MQLISEMLNDLLKMRLKRINTTLSEIDAKKQFFESFSKKYPFKKVEDLFNINVCDLMILMLAVNDSSLPVSEIEDAIRTNQDLAKDMLLEHYLAWDQFVWDLFESGILDIFEEVLSGKASIDDKKQRDGYASIIENAKIFKTSPDHFIKFLKLIRNDLITREQNTEEDFSFAEVLGVKTTLHQHKERMNQRKNKNQKSSRKKRKTEQNTGSVDVENAEARFLLGIISAVKKYYGSLDEKRSSLEKEKKACEKILTLLSPDILLDSNREIAIPKDIDDISSEGIRKEILKVINRHNLSFYAKNSPTLTEEEDALNLLLIKYGLTIADYKANDIPTRSVEETEKMLEQLKGLGISEPALLLSVLQISNPETVTNYASLVARRIVSVDFLSENMSLFDPTSPSYAAIMRNLALIKKQEIKPRDFKDTPSVLIAPHETFKSGIDTLANYGLTQSLKEGINPSFVLEPDLAEAIDTMLELGYESNLAESIDLLNHRDKFKRLKLAKALNIPLSSTEELLGFLTTDRYIVPDDNIDDYIDNAAEHNLPQDVVILDSPKQENPDVKMLAEYESTPRTYSFDGVIISKERVARNLSMLEETGELSSRLIYSVLKGAFLTDEEVSKVINTLSGEKIAAGGPVKLKS